MRSNYFSTNSGATWTQSIAPDAYWYSIASSADGTKLVAAGDGGAINTQVVLAIFTPRQILGTPGHKQVLQAIIGFLFHHHPTGAS